MKDTHQKGFSLAAIIVTIIILGAVGYVGWRIYQHTLSQNENKRPTTSTTSSNLVTEYFAPANVSFTHERKWSYNTRDLTRPVDGRPNQKAAELRLMYRGDNDISLYTIRLSVDDMFTSSDPNYDYKMVDQLSLNGAKIYILFSQPKTGDSDNNSSLELSSCPDKSCPLKMGIPALAPYFEVTASKGLVFPQRLDDSMIPELITILKSLRVGRF